jgi:hypothetical protein
MFRKLLLPAVAAILLTASMTTLAEAKWCVFAAVNPFTKKISSDINGAGTGLEKGACRRAERRCLRKLRKAWKKGKAQQFACKRLT